VRLVKTKKWSRRAGRRSRPRRAHDRARPASAAAVRGFFCPVPPMSTRGPRRHAAADDRPARARWSSCSPGSKRRSPGCAELPSVLVGTTSATGFMEMAVRNGVRHRALSLVNGSFSERFRELVTACGKECIRLDVPPGWRLEPTCCGTRLARTPVDAVTLVHSETSTACSRLEALAAVVREFDDVPAVGDASHRSGFRQTDRWGGGGGGGLPTSSYRVAEGACPPARARAGRGLRADGRAGQDAVGRACTSTW